MDFKWGYPFIMWAWCPGMLGMGTEPITTMMSMSASMMMMSMESICKYSRDVVSPI